ncbi:UPF0280 family protein [Desulfurobacterium atlanticum]|uniref:Uncharacterized protein n=1 Tax=Desulfurobacterium atlanticum TaxID=240169 RepID=A0A238Y3J4_9BACT|nr:UPF0280 family protein [Desulfurobacterium atlanticum]SNR65398.1 hypothetical protein SAMN06265340_10266 [Desulfurobacterium atlanticum]
MKKIRPEKRFYREFVKTEGVSFEISAGESNLWINILDRSAVTENIKVELTEYLIVLREELLRYIEVQPEFLKSLEPIKPVGLMVPEIVRLMISASEKIGVGPMAGVAGAVNFFIGRKLESYGICEYIIENGGDVYLSSSKDRVLKLFTGIDKIDKNIGLKIPPGKWGVCSSSSKIGHSLSLGNSVVATAIDKDPIVADCAATYIANSRTVEEMAEVSKKLTNSKISGVFGVIDGKIVVSGNIEPVKIVKG